MSTYALQMLVNAVPGATGAVPYWNGSTRIWNSLAMGSALQVLRVNAGGTALEFAAPSSGGATTALDNLASVAINTSLVSDTDNTDDIGSDAKGWKNVKLRGVVEIRGAASDANPMASLGQAALSFGAGAGSAVDVSIERQAAGIWRFGLGDLVRIRDNTPTYTTQSKDYGLQLDNATASTSTTTNTSSPPISMFGHGWRSEGAVGDKECIARIWLGVPNAYNGDGVAHKIVIDGNGGNGGTSFTEYFSFGTGYSNGGVFTALTEVITPKLTISGTRSYFDGAEHGSNDFDGVYLDIRSGTKVLYGRAGVGVQAGLWMPHGGWVNYTKLLGVDADVSGNYNGNGDTEANSGFMKSAVTGGNFDFLYDNVVFFRHNNTTLKFTPPAGPGIEFGSNGINFDPGDFILSKLGTAVIKQTGTELMFASTGGLHLMNSYADSYATIALVTGGLWRSEPLSDAAPGSTVIQGRHAYSQASTNKTGGALSLSAGVGTHYFDVLDYTQTGYNIKVITQNLPAGTTLTEGADFTATTSNNTTASNIASAINGSAANAYVAATASGSKVYIFVRPGTRSLALTSSNQAATSTTNSNDGMLTLEGLGVGVTLPGDDASSAKNLFVINSLKALTDVASSYFRVTKNGDQVFGIFKDNVLRLYGPAGANYIGLQASDSAASQVFVLPLDDGEPHRPLITDGANNLSFSKRDVPLIVDKGNSGTSVATDWSAAGQFKITATNNFTLLTPTNAVNGQKVMYVIHQDGTGGWAITFSGDFEQPNEFTAALDATASSTTCILVMYDSARAKYIILSCVTYG